jgi:2-polyprenyl-3-methyl-5-hydroxy-6-metoxy-1,4-benzoquinol methylase
MEPSLLRYNAVLSARYHFVLEKSPRRRSLILDLGCGDGYLAFRLAQRGQRVIGSDQSLTGLELAKARLAELKVNGTVSLLQNSEYKLPFHSGIFDAVTLADVIEHVPYSGELLKSIYETLKPGGHLLLSTPCRIEGKVWDQYHEREYSRRDLEELVKQVFSKYEIFERQLNVFYRVYTFRFAHIPIFRVLLNVLALVGFNVFSIPASVLPLSKAGQLYAVCSK